MPQKPSGHGRPSEVSVHPQLLGRLCLEQTGGRTRQPVAFLLPHHTHPLGQGLMSLSPPLLSPCTSQRFRAPAFLLQAWLGALSVLWPLLVPSPKLCPVGTVKRALGLRTAIV